MRNNRENNRKKNNTKINFLQKNIKLALLVTKTLQKLIIKMLNF